MNFEQKGIHIGGTETDRPPSHVGAPGSSPNLPQARQTVNLRSVVLLFVVAVMMIPFVDENDHTVASNFCQIS